MLTRWIYSIPFYFTEVEAILYIFTVETVTFSNLIYIIMYIYPVVCYHLFMRINIIMFLLFPLHLHWYDRIKWGIASLMVAVVVVLVTVVYVVVLTLVAVHVPLYV